MGKKGVSAEEKRQRILDIYYEKKEVFNLKEIEKYGVKKGVIIQAIKDVNQSLVDDNLVETDRIGSGAFFWALPSKGYQQRQNLINNVSVHTEEVKLEITKGEEKLLKEQTLRQSDDGIREQMLKELAELRRENQELTKKVSLFEKCDPKKLDEMKQKRKTALEAANRWTDNLFEMENWMKKNNPAHSSEEMCKVFPILKDLDYVEA